MLKPELYKRTVDILYNAYFNDTLKHEDCTACAVGNIVNATGGFKGLSNWSDTPHPSWNNVFATYFPFDSNHKRQEIRHSMYWGNAKSEIEQTGYTLEHLAKIEYAFEMAPEGNTNEDWMFNGLVAVLDVLAEIHQVDEPTHDAAVQPFATHYATKQPA